MVLVGLAVYDWDENPEEEKVGEQQNNHIYACKANKTPEYFKTGALISKLTKEKEIMKGTIAAWYDVDSYRKFVTKHEKAGPRDMCGGR